MTPPKTFAHDAFDLPAEAIDARFRWASGRGHPAYLWPDVAMPAWRAALEEIERVTTAVLTDEAAAPALRVEGDAAVRALGVAAYTSGMGPLLGRWLEDDRLRAAPHAAALLRLHLEHGRRRALRLGRELDRALDVLSGAGLRPIILKGAHTARAYFPEPGTRPAADIDLVVAGHEVATAERAFAAAGYDAAGRQPRPHRTEWRPPDAPRQLRSLEVVHAGDPYEIDLHASLERDFFGVRTIRFGPAGSDDLRRWPDRPDGAAVLAQPLLTAYLAAHASEGLHGLTLLRLCELVLVIRRDVADGRLRWPELHDRLLAARALRFVYPAFELAERFAPGTVDPGLRAALAGAATRRMTRVLAGLDPSGAQRLARLSLAERFMWASGPVEHLRRTAYMIWPAWIGRSPGRLRAIYGDRLRRLLRGRVGWRGAATD